MYNAKTNNSNFLVVRKLLMSIIIITVLVTVTTLIFNTFYDKSHDIQMPDITGEQSTDALVLLKKMGFKPLIKNKNNDRIRSGYVINTDPIANSMLTVGSSVIVTISDGFKQVQVPNIVGLSYRQAKQKLKEFGFENINTVQHVSRLQERDRVLSTQPLANQYTNILDEIVIIIGSGEGDIYVPNCINKSIKVCENMWGELGFYNTINTSIDSIMPLGQVVDTYPSYGQSVAKYSQIHIYTSKGNQFVMPNLIGQLWGSVFSYLIKLGWAGILYNDEYIGTSRGVKQEFTTSITKQDPPAGTRIRYGVQVILSFY